MSIDLGIFFGGSTMTVSYFRDDKASIIVNEAGDRTTPSLVAITDNEYSIGLPAKQNMIRNSKNTAPFAKYLIGCSSLESINQDLLKRIDCEISLNDKKEIVFNMEKNGKPYQLSLSEAIEKELKYLNDLTKTSLSVKDCDAVIGVPNYFDQTQSDFLVNCAKKAGFNVFRVIKNPLAACLAYDLEENNTTESTILVYHMGERTLEVSIVSLSNGLYRCIDKIDLNDIGGFCFTDVIVDILCEEFNRKYKSNPNTNKRSLFKLKSNAQELKHILSTMERAHCSIDALFDGIDFDYYLTRQRFEGACSKLYQQALEPVDNILKSNNLTENQIDQVILSGGSTKMCKLQSLIKQKFSESKVLFTQSPDEIISIGCAKQCAFIKASKAKAFQKDDMNFKCISNPIYIKVSERNENTVVFKAKTPIPLKKSLNLTFDLSKPFISVFENEENIIAKINLDQFKTNEINFMIQIKLNETIEITVTETSTNEKITMFLNSNSE